MRSLWAAGSAAMCRTNSATSGRGNISAMPMPKRMPNRRRSSAQDLQWESLQSGNEGKSPKKAAPSPPRNLRTKNSLLSATSAQRERQDEELDKRACRHASNVPLHISLNAGVLYTDRVKYLVTAAVKLLGGHRVLAVYFYECERLKQMTACQNGSCFFRARMAFATLERDAEGNVKWRDSMLENLVDESFYKFRESCVFYKGTDGVTISDFIHQSASGITILEALQVYQYGIRNKQAKKRRCKRDMGIVENEKGPSCAVKSGSWIDRNVMPHYLFYSYDRNQPETQVFCTYCEKFSVIKKPKTGKILSAAMQTKGNRQSAGEKSRLPSGQGNLPGYSKNQR